MATVLITGANRGLGLEFVRQYAAGGWHVLAACRAPGEATDLAAQDGDITPLQLDVAAADSVAALAAELSGQPVDLLINNAGIYGPRGASSGSTDFEAWARVFAVNVQGPTRVLEALLGNLRAGAGKTVVNISSRMGSIAETGAGSLIYRSSKAALNMAMRTAAKELAGDRLIVTLQSPGWVATDMGGTGAALAPAESVSAMRQVIGGLRLQDSGRFFSYDGSELPW